LLFEEDRHDSVSIWNVQTGRVWRRLSPKGDGGFCTHCHFLPNRDLLIVNGNDLHIFDLESLHNKTIDIPTGIWEAFAVSADGRYCILGGQKFRDSPGALVVVDLFHRTMRQTDERITAKLVSAAISHDGRWGVTGDAEGRIQLWDFETLAPIADIGRHDHEISSLALAPGEKFVASSDNSGTKTSMRLWRLPAVWHSNSNAQAAGWHGWPADAPPPARAPFDAEQAKEHQEDWAKYLNVRVEYTNSIGMKLRLIPPGEFLMGSSRQEIDAAIERGPENFTKQFESEAPQHRVTITRPFYLGVGEVSQGLYERITEHNPAHFSLTGAGKNAVKIVSPSALPVESVTWKDAAEFCTLLSIHEGLLPPYEIQGGYAERREGNGYRLPSEAEWEYACRAGTTSLFWSGDAREDLVSVGWFIQNANERTHDEQVPANPFGLVNMHGNVWEWVQDGWQPGYYAKCTNQSAVDPQGSLLAEATRIMRGGAWDSTSTYHCRSASRYAMSPTSKHKYIGFRLALPAETVQQIIKGNSESPASDFDESATPQDGDP
jgi:formylglycine-generating enzyme required for sulfatase activity